MNESQRQSLSHAIKAVLSDVREFDVTFKHPFNMLVTGPSQGGKSRFVKTLLHQREIEPYPSKVILAYKEWQHLYDEMKEQGLVHVFVPSLDDVMNEVDCITPNLLILDDLQHEVARSNRSGGDFVSSMFMRGATIVTVAVYSSYRTSISRVKKPGISH